MRITRRQLAGLVAALPAAAARRTPDGQQAAPSASPAQSAQSAAEDLRQNIAAIRKLAIPAETEPAFSFRVQ